VHQLRVGVGHVDFPGRRNRRLERLRWHAQPAARLVDSARSVGLVVAVRRPLDGGLLLQAPPGFHESRRPRLGDRPRFRRALGIQAALGLAQPAAATLLGLKLRRQLIPARLVELLVLLAIDAVGLLEDLLGDLLVVARRVATRVGIDLRAVDRDHPDLREPRLRAQSKHLTNETRQGALVALAKARDRRVIGHLVRGDHAVGNVLDAATLDRPRGALPTRVGVEQQRDHHRRIMRRPPWPSAR
jgi:hypothetical protein